MVSIRNSVLKVAFNTNNKYILKLVIKKLVLEKMHSYGYTCGMFKRSDAACKMCIIRLISITTETLENRFYVLLIYDFWLWHATT